MILSGSSWGGFPKPEKGAGNNVREKHPPPPKVCLSSAGRACHSERHMLAQACTLEAHGLEPMGERKADSGLTGICGTAYTMCLWVSASVADGLLV